MRACMVHGSVWADLFDGSMLIVGFRMQPGRAGESRNREWLWLLRRRWCPGFRSVTRKDKILSTPILDSSSG